MNIDKLPESGISVCLQEEEYFQPSESFISQANESDISVFERFGSDNFPECYEEYADLLTWDRKWDNILDTGDAPCFKWFSGGKLNASVNCVDRHLEQHADSTAICFVPEPEEDEIINITYGELYKRVNETAALLKEYAGLKKGDRVTIHLPMGVELPVTMLACARIGVIHSVVFGGFSASACADRISDSGSRILITMDGYYRNGKLLDHFEKAGSAVKLSESMGQPVEKVLVWERHRGEWSSGSKLHDDRYVVMGDILESFAGCVVVPEVMDSVDPLFLMYTSGTTGKPKGCQHSTGGYLSYVAGTTRSVLDLGPGDVYWCMADIGWITGHSYIVYGPLSQGASTVIYEGVPTYPDAGRPWRIASELGVNVFHTAPTAIRSLRKIGPDEPAKYNYDFKLMVTVGEPIEPSVWKWYYDVVGKGKAAVVDTWWQTETGGFLCSTLPGVNPMKPGSAGPGVPGIYPVIFDEMGEEIPKGTGKAGNICIRNPWPGQLQTLWGDRERFVDTYFGMYCKDPESVDWRDWPFITGDAATESGDGYVRILGRTDDVINVSGHRLGTKEMESAAMTVDEVAEAAVVPVSHDIKGREPDMYVSLTPGYEASNILAGRISAAICDQIGAIARPRKVWIVPDMPKTRSGKIMRRVLGALSNKDDVGNVMTLANPEVVDEIKRIVA